VNLIGKILRKLAYWVTNYLSRLKNWLLILRELSGAGMGDKALLLVSFLLSPITSFYGLNHNRPPVLLGDVKVRVPQVGTFGLRAGTDDIFHVMRWREPRLYQLIDELLQPDDLFVDAGSNIGFYTLLAGQKVGRGGSVVAVEMMPDTVRSLRSNISSTGLTNVEVIETALASEAGQLIEAHFDPSKLGQASIVDDESAGRRDTVSVQTSRLDEILPKSSIKLMKMDLEGAEYDALLGLSGALARIDTIVFESNDRDQRIFDFFASHGFTVEHLDLTDYVARNDSLRALAA